jgi:Protein of unknown function (DUF2949)
MIKRQRNTDFIQFLESELKLSMTDISVALRHPELENAPLPMLLWEYGLVNIEQLERIFDWLENQVSF